MSRPQIPTPLRLLFVLLAIVVYAACGGDDDGGTGSGGNPPAGPAGNTNANLQQNARGWEVPRLSGQGIYINHTLTDGTPNYCMEYVTSAYHTRWVAYRYDPRTAQRNWTTRTNAWAPEPALAGNASQQVASHLADGREQYFPGYNRGHLVGSAERYYSREANEQTFYMSNMSPMLGRFNTGNWGTIENKCRDEWGRSCTTTGDTLYVVKGGTVAAGQTLGYCTVRTVSGSNARIAVPKYYFMACVRRSRGGSVSGIAFWLEHTAAQGATARSAAITIDELESRTGIDFFCNIPDELEERVESTFNFASWNL